MREEIWIALLVLVVSLFIGFVLGYPLLLLSTALALFAAWNLYRLWRLHKWNEDAQKHSLSQSYGLIAAMQSQLRHKEEEVLHKRDKTEHQLQQFRLAVNALPFALIVIDNDGKMEWANDCSRDIVGVRWPRDKGFRLADLLRHAKLSAALDDGKEVAGAIEFQPSIDSEEIISIHVLRFAPSLRVVVAQDVSRLVLTSKLQSELVANVSHELKTPLTVLLGYLEAISDGVALPDALQKPMREMHKQSERMKSIVTDLLSLAQLENRNSSHAYEWIDLVSLVNELRLTFSSELERKELSLTANLDPTIDLLGDAKELHMAFSNLLANAVNYTKKQGNIEINWHRNNSGAIFSVSDDGIGIDAVHFPRLTQRFYRINQDRSRKSGGTGLGLAIVKHILQNHEAKLEIKSTPGSGSVFSCVFPQKRITENL